MRKIYLLFLFAMSISRVFGQGLKPKDLTGEWNSAPTNEGKMTFRFYGKDSLSFESVVKSGAVLTAKGTFTLDNKKDFTVFTTAMESMGLTQSSTWLIRMADANTMKLQLTTSELPYKWVTETDNTTMTLVRTD